MAQTSAKHRRAIIGVSIAAALIVLLGGTYLTGHAMANGTMPAKTTVEGVPIGRMDHTTAEATLRDGLGPRMTAPITVADRGTKVTIDPAKAGLVVDWDATMDRAGAKNSWNPATIWNTLLGGGPVPLQTKVDTTAVEKTIDKTAGAFAINAKDATVHLDGAKIVTSKAVQGRELDVPATAKSVETAWHQMKTSVPATVKRPAPNITDKAVDEVVTKQLKPMVSGPVRVKTSRGDFSVTPEQIAAVTTITTKDKAITASADTSKLYKDVMAHLNLGFTQPHDASFTLAGGKPTVVPSSVGEGIVEKDFTAIVGSALTRTGSQRDVSVPVKKLDPAFSTDQANAAGVKNVIGEFTTTFPHADYRNTNLGLAAKHINESYVAPGKTFSLDKELGARNSSTGYVDGWVIEGPSLVKEVAGGVSQSATTVFNAAFFAGMTDVEHHPHTLYFSRYPMGREATLYSGSLDVKFRNDTKYGVLVQAVVKPSTPSSQGSITVRLWSTPSWDRITATDPKVTDKKPPSTITQSGKDCHAQGGSEGFHVTYSRQFWKGGSVAKEEPFAWTYQPTNQIVCQPAKDGKKS